MNHETKLNHDDICERAHTISVSGIEKALVNIFTPPDLIVHPMISRTAESVRDRFIESIRGTRYEIFLSYMVTQQEGSISERARRMWDGKITDYQRLVLMSELPGGIPSDIKKLYLCSPCGIAKLTTLHLREYLP